MFKNLKRLLIQIFFPKKCLACKKYGTGLCQECFFKIPKSKNITKNSFSLFDYGDKTARAMIKSLKYKGDKSAVYQAIEYSKTELNRIINDSKYLNREKILVPIPQHKNKTYQRGFNQSKIITQKISKETGINIKDFLIKIRKTKSQVEIKNKIQRSKNLLYSMQSKTKIPEEPLYILIDDVYTTGSTLKEAERALKVSGAKNIISITIAHGYAKN